MSKLTAYIQFLKIQYRLKNVTDEQLKAKIADGDLTPDEYQQITGEAYSANS